MLQQNPVLSNAIEKIFSEDRQFDREERRSLYRESISRPVGIRLTSGREILCFSRNLSFEGIGVISHVEFDPDSEATIEIHSTDDCNSVMAAKLAWCRPFGQGWYISGWHFLALIREKTQ